MTSGRALAHHGEKTRRRDDLAERLSNGALVRDWLRVRAKVHPSRRDLLAGPCRAVVQRFMPTRDQLAHHWQRGIGVPMRRNPDVGDLHGLTFHVGKSPMDSRFSEVSNPTSPRRLCPSLSIFLAALWSRCRLVPHSGQLCQRTDKPLATNTPQPEHRWLVNAGLTTCTRFPAHAALKARIPKNCDHPASWIDLAR